MIGVRAGAKVQRASRSLSTEPVQGGGAAQCLSGLERQAAEGLHSGRTVDSAKSVMRLLKAAKVGEVLIMRGAP